MRSILFFAVLAGCDNSGSLVDNVGCDDSCNPVDDVEPDPIVRVPVDAVFFGEPMTVEVPTWMDRFHVGDVDGDGFVDLVSGAGGNALYWFRGDGVGGLSGRPLLDLGTLEPRIFAALGVLDSADEDSLNLFQFETTDYDRDGRMDLVVTVHYNIDGMSHYATGAILDPSTAAIWATLYQSEARYRAAVIPDLDGDGLVEVGVFGALPEVRTSSGEIWPLDTALADIQYPEVATMHLDDDDQVELVLFVNFGFGVSEVRTWTVSPSGLEPDVRVDGIFGQATSFGPERNGPVTDAFLSTGRGMWRFDGEVLVEEIDMDGTRWFSSLPTGDLDGDGALDVLAVGHDVDPLLYASAPDGPLTPIPYVGPSEPGQQIQFADLNGDGLDDIIRPGWNNDTSEHFLDVLMNISDNP